MRVTMKAYSLNFSLTLDPLAENFIEKDDWNGSIIMKGSNQPFYTFLSAFSPSLRLFFRTGREPAFTHPLPTFTPVAASTFKLRPRTNFISCFFWANYDYRSGTVVLPQVPNRGGNTGYRASRPPRIALLFKVLRTLWIDWPIRQVSDAIMERC